MNRPRKKQQTIKKKSKRSSSDQNTFIQYILSIGRFFNILYWFFTAYQLDNTESDLPATLLLFTELAMAYLARQASVIMEYKSRALKLNFW